MNVKAFALLSLLALPVQAEWLRAGETTDGVVHYVDVDTLRKVGPGIVSIWVRVELPKPTFGKETQSMRVLVEHNCISHRQRYVKLINYPGRNLTGEGEIEKGQSDWMGIQVDSISELVHNNICKYK